MEEDANVKKEKQRLDDNLNGPTKDNAHICINVESQECTYGSRKRQR